MERILLAAEHWPGGTRDVKVTFGHVREVKHADTLDCSQVKKEQGHGPAWWILLDGTPSFAASNSSSGLQAADQFAGMLSSAMLAKPI